MTLLQPHEGIVGTDRAGDLLLSLEEANVHVRDLVAHLAYKLYRATLVGQPAPRIAELHTRMTAPVPGDLVLVIDSIYACDLDTRVKGLGYLVARRAEWWTTDEVYAAELAEDPDVERLVERDAIYVQYGPAAADVCRWVNCTVVAAPSKEPPP